MNYYHILHLNQKRKSKDGDNDDSGVCGGGCGGETLRRRKYTGEIQADKKPSNITFQTSLILGTDGPVDESQLHLANHC